MSALFNNISRKRIKITVLATYNLVNNYMQALLESDKELSVIDNAVTNMELLKKVSRNTPDIVLICLMDNEGKNIDIVTELFKVAPQTKVVILSSPNSLLDQPAALKLGVTGIIGTNQNLKVLIRAIKQVSEGEVWLNQNLIAQLLGGDFHSGNGKSKIKGFYKLDDLTNRELEVVKMVALGMNNKDISKKLYISEATVRHHLSSIYSKLDVEDRLNLAIYAYQQGIVQPQAKSL